MALFASIVSYPPLAQVTVIPSHLQEISFTAVIGSSQSFPDVPWQASIWFDHSAYAGNNHNRWQALDLQKSDTQPKTLLEGSDGKVFRHTFTGKLATPFTEARKTYKGRCIRFTLRYRVNASAQWQWVNMQFGTQDGWIILQAPVDPNFLSASPVELTSGWTLRRVKSDAPDARLYSIESVQPIPKPTGQDARPEGRVLGRITLLCRYFAMVRLWNPWMAPRHGRDKFNIGEQAVLLSFLRSDGLHVVLLAVNGVDDILTTLVSNDSGEIVVISRNDSGKDGKFRILAASAWDPEVALSAVMCEMRKMVVASKAHTDVADQLEYNVKAESVDSETVLVSTDEPEPGPQWLESWYDSLAYCTWNSLGQNLSDQRILDALQDLENNGIRISTLIIDDNWQTLDGKQGETQQGHRGMMDFEANKTGFPDGMKAFTSALRKKYPYVNNIAVWHALFGYWGSISPNGSIAKNYKTLSVPNINGSDDGTVLAIHPDDIHRFYNDFYSFLSSAGVTGVKTDAQFMLDNLSSTLDRKTLIPAYRAAWTQAHLQHLAGKAISCMSHIPQIMYGSFLPTNTPRIVFRNSDDFFPDVPTSHPWHVFTNAHNALFSQHLNVLPDWDMFQTSHPYSGFHAASRCLSGGPIYITDTPGKHDLDLISQMAARNPRGQSVILRPSNVAKTIGIYDNYDEGHVLKLGVYDGKADVGSGMIGVFNVSDHEIRFVVPITDFPGVEGESSDEEEDILDTSSKRWVIRSHVSGAITLPISASMPLAPSALLHASLAVRGYDIWTARPVHSVASPFGHPIDVAVLGLLGKMSGAVAILDSNFATTEKGDRLRIRVQLKAMGVLGVWFSDLGGRKVEDLIVMMKGQVIPASSVKITDVPEDEDEGEGLSKQMEGLNVQENQKQNPEPKVLTIDVEAAWDEMKLDAGWNNEVAVDIIIG